VQSSQAGREEQGDRTRWVAATLVFGPFVLKRFLELGTHDYIYWLAVDYSSHLVSLTGALFAYRRGLLSSPRQSVGIIGSVALMLVVLLLSVTQIGEWDAQPEELTALSLSHYPHIGDPLMKVLDLTVGLALAAISQEVAFRRVLFVLLERRFNDRALVVVLSSLAFGLMHVTYGVTNTFMAFFNGLLLGVLFALTGRVWPCAIIHFVVDLRAFLSS
jgi:membrane protease YdiL (CAAX protease family)